MANRKAGIERGIITTMSCERLQAGRFPVVTQTFLMSAFGKSTIDSEWPKLGREAAVA